MMTMMQTSVSVPIKVAGTLALSLSAWTILMASYADIDNPLTPFNVRIVIVLTTVLTVVLCGFAIRSIWKNLP